MPYLRWIHKSWNIFWTFIGVLVLTVAIIFGTVFGLMQLQPVKNQIAIELENRFTQNFEGVLDIGRIDGLLPLHIEMTDVKVYPDSSTFTPVFETSAITASMDVWSLLQNRFVVKSIEVQSPKTTIDPDSEFSVENAFQTKPLAPLKENKVLDFDPAIGFQIIIPSVKVQNGSIVLRNVIENGNQFSSADSVHFQNLNMEMFFEYTSEQRFVDIDRITFNSPELNLPEVELFGQIYNDDRFFELNAINLKVGNSSARFSGEADGVNILEDDIEQQFTNSTLTMIVENFSIEPNYLSRFIPGTPELTDNLQGSWDGAGTLDSLNFSNAEFLMGESFINFNGYLTNLSPDIHSKYDINIESFIISENELKTLGAPYLDIQQMEGIGAARLEGNVTGDFNSTQANIQLLSSRGGVSVNGGFEWGQQTAFDFKFTTDSLDVGYLVDPGITQTNLSLNGEIKSSSFDFKESEGGMIIRSDKSMVGNRNFEQVSILANWKDGFIEPDIQLSINNSVITSNGWIDLKPESPEYSLQGKAGQIQLTDLIQDDRMRPVTADIEYDLNLKGKDLDKIYGQVSLDVLSAIVENDTLGRHQLYFDLNEPNSRNRILRFTSTAFDATIEGSYHPSDLVELSGQWGTYITQRFRDEILFDTTVVSSDSIPYIRNQDISVTGRLKKTGLITFYYPEFPTIASSARINSSINVNSERLLFNSSLTDTKTQIDNFKADSLVLQVTGGFRRDADIKEFSSLQFQASAAYVDFNGLQGRQFNFSTNLNQDSVEIQNSIQQLADNSSFEFRSTGTLSEEAITLNIYNFDLGGSMYRWKNRGIPRVQYQSDHKLTFQDFQFDSEDQFVEIDGTFSDSTEDSVNYNVGEVDLAKISQILGGRISFGGILNGEFTTRTLTTVPTIEGNINVEAFNLNRTLVGDINVVSRYNSIEDRFDTDISVTTDSAKYPGYYTNNDRKGQEFDINGYVLAPVDGDFPQTDSLYRFEADFENIDLWILPFIGPKVFAEGSGLANGKGVIWGNLDTYDFTADFMVGTDDAAYIRPQFLDTYYYAQGGIEFTRQNGFTFNDIYLIDPSGGNAILSGFYDLNDFAPTDSMDISLEMDEFQFLNSSFDPSLAFFGKAYGSSTVTISGTNFDPVLRTEQPILISDFSEISIPLLEETELNEDNRFIRFVESFEASDIQKGSFSPNSRNRLNQTGEIQEEQLSFAERFTLDLQFVANQPMTVRLIFDPVTGDIVTTEGTGRIRILLEDEQVTMFGRFDIQGGRYQFVSGDIFTRRFELESGGTIIWEGDPANARLNLNAIYSARPDINTLSNTGRRDPDNTQRVPVDLVLNIGGTISSIENDFYFRLPDTFESQQSSTLSTQLAAINRDEDMKLLQAANFMLMGDFIPVSSNNETQNNLFGDNISGSGAVLNPLLSSQVINPLLSNQVNSLLNSDLSSLDVDFNLNTYNQVDLGVALRLYNDKLILRREGQITGRQSNIGDLGATYRINRTFAVTAFHRQDLTFGTLSSAEQSQQTQDINGVGVEAKVSFNTWGEFFDRLLSPFRKIFGAKDEEQNQEEITENRREEDPE